MAMIALLRTKTKRLSLSAIAAAAVCAGSALGAFVEFMRWLSASFAPVYPVPIVGDETT